METYDLSPVERRALDSIIQYVFDHPEKIGLPEDDLDAIRSTGVPRGILQPLIAALRNKDYLTYEKDHSDGNYYFQPSHKCLQLIEGKLSDPQRDSDADNLIPASDRFVRLDDNAQIRDEAVKALDELVDALNHKAPNDLFARAEDRLAVVSEVRSLSDQLKAPVIRAQVIAQAMADKGLLKWLALATAAGPVGDAATAVLTFLARLASVVIS